VLIGDSTVQQLQSRIRSTLSNALAGTGSSLTTLSQIGISFQKDGSLALDSAKLTKAMNSNFPDLAALFGVQGKSGNSLLSFVSSGADSKPGDYQVNITAAATQAAAVAANAAAGSTLIDANQRRVFGDDRRRRQRRSRARAWHLYPGPAS
jgi:flagellar hook-associated protein 2